MEQDKEDIEFENLLADSRHKELKSILEQIANSISNMNNKDMSLAIKLQTQRLEELVRTLSKTSTTPIDDTDKLLPALQGIANEIVTSNSLLIETLNTRLLPDSFELNKYMGVTQSVKVKYKQANEIQLT